MARFCRACGRSLDEDGHDIEDVSEGVEVETPAGTFKRFLHDAYNTRIQRRYGCRVRLVGVSPTTGRRITPASPQREKALGLAGFVHVNNLEAKS